MTVLKRKLLHASVACPHQCQYCFAKWENYRNDETLTNAPRKDLLVYPFCDAELESQDFTTVLSSIIEQSDLDKCRIVISISTKSYLQDSTLNELRAFHERLARYGGFLKVGVSFTNKSFSDIEKGAASFLERVNLLKRLTQHGIMQSVVLKPILPFVSQKEYIEILDVVSDYSDKFLLGGLYVNESTTFYKDYIRGKYEAVLREISWLNGSKWLYLDSEETQKAIKNYLIGKKKQAFASDQELVESWLEDER